MQYRGRANSVSDEVCWPSSAVPWYRLGSCIKYASRQSNFCHKFTAELVYHRVNSLRSVGVAGTSILNQFELGDVMMSIQRVSIGS